MNSSQSTCSEDMEFDFKNIVACEKENLYNMKRQLESFDMDTDDGDESQIIIQEMSPGTKKADNSNWQVLNDQIRDQMEKINKYSIMEYEWELKQNELQNVINHMTAELKCQKCNENTLISKIEDYEKRLKCTQKELCDNQVKLEEQNCEIKKLCITRKTNEEEICKLRGQLCHSTKESDRLIENIKGLTEDLTYAKTEIKAQKLCIATMEENIKNDRETFSCELKNKCKKLKEMKTLYDETKCQLDQETCKTKNLVLALNDLNKTNEKNSCDLHNCLLESKTERCVKDSTICKLENEIEELQQQNELKDIALRYNLNDCQSEQMRVFSEKLCKFKQKYVSNLCQDKKIQKPTCCNVKTNCCSTQTKCCKVEKCCENLKTVTKICCKNMNTPQSCEPICPPICEQKCQPKCEPKCPLICEPKCPPKCEPKCPPKCEPKCPPKCEPKCPPKCPPKCEQKCPLKCEKSCNSCNNTDSNDLICKLSNLKKDIETLRMK